MQIYMPPKMHTHSGEERRLGIEIEFAGVEPQSVMNTITSLWEGRVRENHAFDYVVEETALGEFRVELDSAQLQNIARKAGDVENEAHHLERLALPLLTKTAEILVPWEIVAPPVKLSRLNELTHLVAQLRQQGALGTRHSVQYAFGLHLNIELPNLEASTMLAYMRAYCCLYEWIVQWEHIDFARKLTPYIRHFNQDYVTYILDPLYQPNGQQLIDDYLRYNPTRNRSLDMLPLFAEIDENRVRSVVDDPRINPRPTFHYRLPNCDIDNPRWNIDHAWHAWLQVEYLANDTSKLKALSAAYLKDMQRLTHNLDGQWPEQIKQYLVDV